VCNQLKYRTIKSKHVANYIINNYNKINIERFKNTIASIKQELLKIKIKNYFWKYNLIKNLNAKLKKIYQIKVQTILFFLIKDAKRTQT